MNEPGAKIPPSEERDGAGGQTAQVVDVEILERHYQIRCERPELIAWIAQLVNEQAASIRQLSPESDLSDQDVLVRVSFRLALSLYHGRRELESLKEAAKAAEARIESLARAIENLLPPA
ncbi:MAG: cell division protein ZapA [Deltaproteobacteria bacterium]|jgi:cell division protein ZapA (FtsZ GTPase activity inhibitor)|nr:cell division protein ZapA [Deltaproteobacteria bacterium]